MKDRVKPSRVIRWLNKVILVTVMVDSAVFGPCPGSARWFAKRSTHGGSCGWLLQARAEAGLLHH
eukprot:4321182-Pyramimonas_sp.AAC.1